MKRFPIVAMRVNDPIDSLAHGLAVSVPGESNRWT